MTTNLPPLPEPIWGYSTNTPKFTADQMHAYARAAMSQAGAEPTAVELLGAVSRGWCHELNASKVMDTDLAIAIAAEVSALYAAPTAQLPAREPLTEAQVLRLFNGPGVSASDRFKINAAMFVRFWRLFEAVNGITATPADKEQP